jgi:hypothetical protein
VFVLFQLAPFAAAPQFTVVPQRRVACCPGNALVDLSQERTPVHSLTDSHVHTGAFLRFPSEKLVVFILGVYLLGAWNTSFNRYDATNKFMQKRRENNRVCKEAELSGPSLHAASVNKHTH